MDLLEELQWRGCSTVEPDLKAQGPSGGSNLCSSQDLRGFRSDG